MTDQKTPSPAAAATEPEADDKRISRRSLLAGSAGLTLGSMALAGVAPGMAPGVAHADHEPVTGPHAHRGHLAGSGSQRAYSVPPRLEDDVAHDPTAIPGPLPRREPQTVQVYLETEEKEALLEQLPEDLAPLVRGERRVVLRHP